MMFENSKWISVSYEKRPDQSILMRKCFNVDAIPTKATLSIAALGYGVCTINGKDVTQNVLTTPYTRYDKTVYYNEYDISTLIFKGGNCIAVHLGNGFYNNSCDGWGYSSAPWRDTPKLIAVIELCLTDGSKKRIASDSSWQFHMGPVVYNQMREGEIYDARLEQTNYDRISFDASEWKNALIVRGPGGITKKNFSEPERIIRRIQGQYLGNGIYDFGEDISGFCEIEAVGAKGTEISITYSERLNADNSLDNVNINAFNHHELKHCDKYIMKGQAAEKWHPVFVYHGFRYVKVCNTPATFKICALLVHTNLRKTAEFTCSNEVLSKLHEASVRATLTNFHSVPTDCPHREQNGWTADAHLSSEQALINFDMRMAYKKWIADFRDAQCANGQLPSVVPTPECGYRSYNGIAWEGAVIIIPYNIYKAYGEISVVKENFDVMKKYMDFLGTMAEDYIISYGLGDWCLPKNTVMCDARITNTAYYYRLAVIMNEFSALLNENTEKFAHLAQSIKNSYRKRFIENGMDINQTALSVGLDFGLYEDSEKPKKIQQLVSLIEAADYHFECGVLGTKALFAVLSESNNNDVIYRAVTNNTYPSYACWMNSGLSSLAEDWEMENSLNHHMFSVVNYWLLRYVAGIRLEEGVVSFKPCLLKGIDFKANYSEYSIEKKGNKIIVASPCENKVDIGGKHYYTCKGTNNYTL